MLTTKVEIIDPPLGPNCTAILSWVSPTERVDGSPFSQSEILKYDIFIGHDSDLWYRIVGIYNSNLTHWEESGLLGGDNYFTMTVTDMINQESDQSNEVLQFVDERCK